MARAGGRTRTGRSSDRLGGRCSVCQSAPSAQLKRRQVQGSVAARGRAAAVASGRAARARRGGQVIGRRVMGRRVTAPSDRSEPIVARPLLTSKACGARLSVSEGGRHVARREDDKCASYGSLFIGQSSGTQVETEHGRRKPVGAVIAACGGCARARGSGRRQRRRKRRTEQPAAPRRTRVRCRRCGGEGARGLKQGGREIAVTDV